MHGLYPPVFILYLRSHFTYLSDTCMNISTLQTTTGGVLNMFTDTKPVEVNVYFAKTLDGRR